MAKKTAKKSAKRASGNRARIPVTQPEKDVPKRTKGAEQFQAEKSEPTEETVNTTYNPEVEDIANPSPQTYKRGDKINRTQGNFDDFVTGLKPIGRTVNVTLEYEGKTINIPSVPGRALIDLVNMHHQHYLNG